MGEHIAGICNRALRSNKSKKGREGSEDNPTTSQTKEYRKPTSTDGGQPAVTCEPVHEISNNLTF